MAYSAMARVLSCPDILPQILVKVSATLDLVRCAAVGPAWIDSVTSDHFAVEYTELHAPSTVGFLSEFQSAIDPLFELVAIDEPPASDTVMKLRARVNYFELSQSLILSSRDGFLLTKSIFGQLGYFTSCPFDTSSMPTFAGTIIPPIPHILNQFQINTLGQFGVIPDAVPGGMAFFDFDPPTELVRTNDGITFNSGSMFQVHVCVYSNHAWTRFISLPIPPPSNPVIFHKNPYCLIIRDVVFMVYAVGVVVAFDTSNSLFSVIPLPGVFDSGLVSDTSYSLSEHHAGGLFLAHWRVGSIYNWVLTIEGGELVWNQIEIIHLMDIFLSSFGSRFWEDFFCDGSLPDGWHIFHGIQLRSVTRDGEYILLSVGYDRSLFVLNCKNKTIRKIDAVYGDGEVGSVFVLTEQWPPQVLTPMN